VVADGVRTLAARARASTGEIQGMIARLQDAGRDAVRNVDAGEMLAKQSVDQAVQVADSFRAIKQAVAQLTDMNAQIASAAEQQYAVAEEVHRNLARITQAAQTAGSNTEATAGAAKQLGGLAGELRTMLRRYENRAGAARAGRAAARPPAPAEGRSR
jgi:methyl-accepting chemotaxis protein